MKPLAAQPETFPTDQKSQLPREEPGRDSAEQEGGGRGGGSLGTEGHPQVYGSWGAWPPPIFQTMCSLATR